MGGGEQLRVERMADDHNGPRRFGRGRNRLSNVTPTPQGTKGEKKKIYFTFKQWFYSPVAVRGPSLTISVTELLSVTN